MTLEKTLNDFVAKTAKSKVTVIVPLFGYWNNVESKQLNLETFRLSMSNVLSSLHQVYILFIGEPKTLPVDVANDIVIKSQAGNSKGIPVSTGAPYSEYIRVGIEAAQTETDSQFFIIINPWIMIQQHGIDAMVDRVNRGDAAKVISGFDLRKQIQAEAFLEYRTNVPKETRDLNFNFLGMTRQYSEVFRLDPQIKTHQFLSRDGWQDMYSKGYDVITSDIIPIFPFDVDWKELETLEDFEIDRAYFLKKWGFDPGLDYDKVD